MKTRRPSAVAIAAAVFICIAVIAAGMLVKSFLDKKRQPSSTNIHNVVDDAWGSKVKYNGKTYKQKEGLTSILLLGIDEADYSNTTEAIGTAGRSDAIVLLVLNDKTKTIKTLSISRDTIVNVDYYNKKGTYLFSNPLQINMQYAFGDSARRSCYLTKKKVSELLHGRHIDGCASITIDGLPEVIDLIGGISLKLNEDYTYIDPGWKKGAEIDFAGKDAERFIRYRDTNEQGSNDDRMRRQEWFLSQLFEKVDTNTIGAEIDDILDKAAAYIESDLDADMLQKLKTYKLDPERLTLPGESAAGELHDEYHVDDEALQQMLIELFYDPA